MEGITLFISVILFIFGVLQIILFFKLWGMTNNVYEIKNLIKSSVKEKHTKNIKVTHTCKKFEPGDIVIYKKTGENFKVIKKIGENSYECREINGTMKYTLNGIDLNESVSNNTNSNKEDFPEGTKFNKGDVVLYKAENIKLIITGYMPPNVFKCATIDNIEKIYYFQEDYLEKFTE